jgi:nitrogen regulatory protein PII
MAEDEQAQNDDHPDQQATKMIMAIVQRGRADQAVKGALRSGAQAATVFFGRGMGVRERLGLLGLAIQPEKEVIVAPEDYVDRIITGMVRASRLDQPGVGFLFVTPVDRVVGLLEAEEIVRESTAASESN